jgi:hypothetical protein
VWNALLIWLGLRSRAVPPTRETAAEWIRDVVEIRALLQGLGHLPDLEIQSDRIMQELRSSIRAEITDFETFRSAVAQAALKAKAMPAAGPFPLLEALAEASDRDAVQSILNADPIGGLVPFIEQIPVRKDGHLIWRSPVDHSLIRRRPADFPSFLANVQELERLYSQPIPAREDAPRLEVQDALMRLRRELEREKSYLPTPLQFLEMKLAEYKATSRRPGTAVSIEALLSLLDRIAALHNTPALSGAGVAEQVARYLATPGIQTPWLTNRLLSLALHGRLTAATGQRIGTLERRKLESIRSEIAAGYYDAAETARRLRRLERCGVDIMSLVYPLLRLQELCYSHEPVRSGERKRSVITGQS